MDGGCAGRESGTRRVRRNAHVAGEADKRQGQGGEDGGVCGNGCED